MQVTDWALVLPQQIALKRVLVHNVPAAAVAAMSERSAAEIQFQVTPRMPRVALAVHIRYWDSEQFGQDTSPPLGIELGRRDIERHVS